MTIRRLKAYDSWPEPVDHSGYPKTEKEARRRGLSYWCPLGGCGGSMGCVCTC